MSAEDVVVTGWRRLPDGSLHAEATWSGTPQVGYQLEVDAEGGLRRWAATAHAGSLTTRELREVPVARVVRAALAASSRARPVYVSPVLTPLDETAQDPETELLRWRVYASDFRDRPRPGVAGRGDRPYAALAACYVAAFDAGEARPVEAVGRDLGLSGTRVRNYLTKARERGLLTPAAPGRAGGQLTDRAHGVLAGRT